MRCFNCCGEDDMHKSYDNGPFMSNNAAGHNAGYRATEAAPKDTQAVAIQPIVVLALQVDELKEITDNFGTKSLIGEGSLDEFTMVS
ncbi:hypothetical protein L6452_21377 [Arctium lappa]|uniref:Uncharacterized protein n=1 Tax=Arctium lappa TaxID=4217 RepID=A0ACB9BEV5_ARCLA|nr:hypothetical protein L6452_21377 [Arctium lappa]